MRLEWIRVSRRPARPVWAIGLVAAWVGLVALAVYLSQTTGRVVTLCWFRRLTGLPCPTCGATRGLLALLAGEGAKAWLCNPLLATLVVLWVVLVSVRVCFARAVRIRVSRREALLGWGALVLAILANWAYLITQNR